MAPASGAPAPRPSGLRSRDRGFKPLNLVINWVSTEPGISGAGAAEADGAIGHDRGPGKGPMLSALRHLQGADASHCS